MSEKPLVDIDGSYLEGGGQILRIALALSCILRRPVRISNIRKNRPKPGLSAQHLYGLRLLKEVTRARVVGDVINSTEVEFYPRDIKSGSFQVNPKTAASISLILQVALPVLLFAPQPTTLELQGGTNVGMAPQIDFLTEVFRPNLERFHASFDFDLNRRGYYPRGGGSVRVQVAPVKRLQAANLTDFGQLTAVEGWCFVAGQIPIQVASRMKGAAEQTLAQAVRPETLAIDAYKEDAAVARDNGFGCVFKATTSTNCTLGASALGERNADENELGRKAALELRHCLLQGICVDQFVQDQLIIFMALAEGVSAMYTVPLTNHTQTAIYVVEIMTGVKFKVGPPSGERVRVSCTGIGHKNSQLQTKRRQ